MLHALSDNGTIVAIATPPGRGGIAVVKLSGPDAITIGTQLVRTHRDPAAHDRVLCLGQIVIDEYPLDTVLITVMHGPTSSTGEDVVEIQLHGGRAVAETVVRLAIEAGAHPAGPGEFTKRAFLNGKLDLAQAEAIMEVVAADTREHLRHAGRLLDGAFSRRIHDIAVSVADIRAGLEFAIDFSHDSSDTTAAATFHAAFAAIIPAIDDLLATAETADRVRRGVSVVIAGPVNAGKSSLFNALLGHDRAIVTATPGTTRDWIQESLVFDGMALSLIDTAGHRETTDPVEQAGIEAASRRIEDADIVIILIPPEEAVPPLDIPNGKRIIRVASKADKASHLPIPDALPVSVVTGEGIDALRAAITTQVADLTDVSADSIVLVARHREELAAARECLIRAAELGDTDDELRALELQDALGHLGAITGENADDTLLDRIFAGFCIGK